MWINNGSPKGAFTQSFTPPLHHLYTIFTPSLHHLYTTFTLSLHHLYTTITPPLHHIYTIFTLHNYTTFTPSLHVTITPDKAEFEYVQYLTIIFTLKIEHVQYSNIFSVKSATCLPLTYYWLTDYFLYWYMTIKLLKYIHCIVVIKYFIYSKYNIMDINNLKI